jgi:hypothetical protein
MSPRARAVLILGALLPLSVAVAFLAGTALSAPAEGAAVALGIMFAAALGAAIYALNHRRLGRRQDGEAYPVANLGWSPAQAIVTGEPHLIAESESAQRIKWLFELSKLTSRATRDHGLASKTVVSLDYFALRATNWRFDWNSLRVVLVDQTITIETMGDLLGPVDGDFGIPLARMALAQHCEETEILCAVNLLRVSSMNVGRLSLSNRQLALLLLLNVTGKIAEEELSTVARKLTATMNLGENPMRLLQLDLLNPWTMRRTALSEKLWLAGVNAIFTRSGLEHLRLREVGATPFDRLDAETGGEVSEGPLVSIIMTCYNPDIALVTAVRSMIAQTWQHWELLITDDASPQNSNALLSEVAAMDPRIRVIRNIENAGTYVRRNEAIIASYGDFITMQDSDDWVHPRRLEIQMRHLIVNETMLANLSQSVRMSEDLTFVQPRGTSIRIAESSLLFRKNAVLARIGYFDSVRKAADSEFRLRLEASIGSEIEVVEIEAPLSLVRFNGASLSGSDLGDGWIHPARIAYRGAQAEWRQERLSGGLPLTIEFPLDLRPFPAHPHLTGGTAPVHDLDVLFVLDTTGRGAAEAIVRESVSDIRALLEVGLRVGVRRAIALGELRPLTSTHHSLQCLINSGVLVEALAVDETRSTLTVIRHPECLTGVGDSERPVETDRVTVVGGRSQIPRMYSSEGLANLGLDPAHVTWMSRSAWSKELADLCAETAKRDCFSL